LPSLEEENKEEENKEEEKEDALPSSSSPPTKSSSSPTPNQGIVTATGSSLAASQQSGMAKSIMESATFGSISLNSPPRMTRAIMSPRSLFFDTKSEGSRKSQQQHGGDGGAANQRSSKTTMVDKNYDVHAGFPDN
jgi:hypothetical protein